MIDEDEQVMVLDSTSILKVSQSTPSSSVRGQNSVIIHEGKASITGIIFEGNPGSESIEYSLNSQALNSDLLK